MSKIRKLPLTLLLCAVLLGTAAAGEASASHGQITYFEASSDLLSAKTRPHDLQQMEALGVRAL